VPNFFISQNPKQQMTRERIIQISIISASVIVFLIVLIFTIDYVAYRDGRIKNRLAKKFCECCLKETVQKGAFERLDEGFEYASGLDDCYGKEFKKYGKGMTDKQREAFIEDVQELVFKKCPASVEKVFGAAPQFDR
jgi:hypothetical protein